MNAFRWILGGLAACLVIGATAAEAAVCRDVLREMTYGETAAKIAKTPADFGKAADEFRKATEKASGCAAAWFNLGLMLEKAERYLPAKEAYETYLTVDPNAEDAEEVMKKIFSLEYLAQNAAGGEAESRETAREGTLQSAVGRWIETHFPDQASMRRKDEWIALPEGADQLRIEYSGCVSNCKNLPEKNPVRHFLFRVTAENRFEGTLESQLPNIGKCRSRRESFPAKAFLSSDRETLIIKLEPYSWYSPFECKEIYNADPFSITLTRQ